MGRSLRCHGAPHSPSLFRGVGPFSASPPPRHTICTGASGAAGVVLGLAAGAWSQHQRHARIHGSQHGTSKANNNISLQSAANSLQASPELMGNLRRAISQQDGDAVQRVLKGLKAQGRLPLFSSYPRQLPSGRQVSLRDLQSVGIDASEGLLQQPNTYGPALGLVLLLSLVAASCSALFRGSPLGPVLTVAFLLAAFATIAVAATNPEMVYERIGIGPEELERRTVHESAHFLVGYLLGAPVRSYAVGGSSGPQVEFDEETGPLSGFRESKSALDVLCVVACSGIAGEALVYKNAQGGGADLRILDQVLDGRIGEEVGGPDQKMDYTRWGVFYAASMLRAHRASWEALQRAMSDGADISDCLDAIEAAGIPVAETRR